MISKSVNDQSADSESGPTDDLVFELPRSRLRLHVKFIYPVPEPLNKIFKIKEFWTQIERFTTPRIEKHPQYKEHPLAGDLGGGAPSPRTP